MLEKQKRVKLKGKPKHELRQKIFDRDKWCIVCGDSNNNEWHHDPCGPDRSDELEKGVRLCQRCHRQRHDGPDSQKIRQACVDYLHRLYPAYYARGENLHE